MKSNFIKSGILSVGLLSAVSLAAFPLSNQNVNAQTPAVNPGAITADGRLNEYSPETAPVLERGVVSPAVRDVQLLLRRLGFYYGAFDGIYGPRTVSSVITFQKSRNLTANGTVNQDTWQALINADRRTSPAPTINLSRYSPQTAPLLRIGSRGQAVKDVQAFLKQQGFYTGVVTGVYDRATATAVESFQQRHTNLTNDGIVGPRTWAVIINAASNPIAIQ